MSTRDDATLSEAERAALAGLESKAEADDPRLAAQLRGRRRTLPKLTVPPMIFHLSHTVVGPILALVGLVVLVFSLGTAFPLAVVATAVFFGGMILSAGLVRDLIARQRERRVPRS